MIQEKNKHPFTIHFGQICLFKGDAEDLLNPSKVQDMVRKYLAYRALAIKENYDIEIIKGDQIVNSKH